MTTSLESQDLYSASTPVSDTTIQTTTVNNGINDDQAAAPGTRLQTWILDHASSVEAVAQMSDWDAVYVEKIIAGHIAVTAGIAVKLERVTQIPAYSWLQLEDLYRADRPHLNRKKVSL